MSTGDARGAHDNRGSSRRKRSSRGSSRPTLHPERMWRLFRKAGVLVKLLTVVLLLVTALGLAFLLVPFHVIVPHPAPPPLELVLDCPPPVASAIAGSGGLPNPVPAVPEMAATQDQLCAGFGRRRVLTGLLLTAGGLLNAAALLEWARIKRRSKRRQRRSKRPARVTGSSTTDAANADNAYSPDAGEQTGPTSQQV